MFRALALLILPLVAMATPEAFPPTQPGTNELKTLPSGLLLRSEVPAGAESQGYFDNSNTLFRPLFRYIDSRGIAMTTPVEARMEPGQMYFWVAEAERSKVDGSAGGVTVIEVPERRVASRGARGSYSESNYNEALVALRAWLDARADVEAAGEPYPVFWNGPFTPWFARRFEVHIPVRERPPAAPVQD
jgi:hypothetical protein